MEVIHPSVDDQVSHYFKRRKMFPTQEIIEERPDGSLIVTFRVGRFEAIRDILKSWIPHIIILSPKDFRDDLLHDIKEWVMKQEKK
jgi:predicted DNA-binding transcriptional regulator YafY